MEIYSLTLDLTELTKILDESTVRFSATIVENSLFYFMLKNFTLYYL